MDCQYVGSRSLLLSCKRKAKIIIPDFDGFDPSEYKNISSNEVLHVCPQAIPYFVKKVLPTISNPFVLLTNNSDWTIPNDIQSEFDILVNHSLLVHWFAQNCIIDHPKVTRIPIGLDYHTLIPSKNKQFSWSQPEKHSWGLKKQPIEQEQELIQLKNSSKPFWERSLKAYANFQFLMNTRYAKVDRIECYNTVPKELVFYEPTKTTRDVCWTNMIKYTFVLSPQGNGLDCHRTWEALCLGCIPILKTSGLNKLFEDLPVWIVEDWKEVTLENMQKKIDEYKGKTFKLEKLTLSYWQKLLALKQNGLPL